MQDKTMPEPRTEIEKIKKLLTLSSSQNDADAAAALGQALELLSRHGLAPNEVDTH